MSRAVLADTGPLCAAVDIDDQYHLRARDELDRLQRERRPVLVAYTTLAEGHGLVLGRLGTATGSQWLANLVETASGASMGLEEPGGRPEVADAARTIAVAREAATRAASTISTMMTRSREEGARDGHSTRGGKPDRRA